MHITKTWKYRKQKLIAFLREADKYILIESGILTYFSTAQPDRPTKKPSKDVQDTWNMISQVDHVLQLGDEGKSLTQTYMLGQKWVNAF